MLGSANTPICVPTNAAVSSAITSSRLSGIPDKRDYPNLFIIPTCMSNIAVGERFKIPLFMIIISVFSWVCLICLNNQKGLWSLWDSSISYQHFGQRGPPAFQEPDASALLI